MLRTLRQRLNKLIPPLPHLSPEEEAKYRARFLKVDATQTSLGMFFFVLLVFPSFFNDYQFFGFSTTFYLLLALRMVVIVCSILFIIFIRRIKDYTLYDKVIVIWQVLSIFVVLSVNLTRPPDYYMFVAIDISIISTVYIVFRSRFITQVAQALAFTAADLSIILIAKDMTAPSLRAIIAGYILANCLGMTALWMLNAARRREFLSQEQEEAVLKENQRLEAEKFKQSRLESIGAMAGGIAHDFNNVLTGVIGNIDLTSEALNAHNHNEAHLRLKDAMRAAEHGKNLSRQLLTFAKGGAPDMKVIALPELIREAAAFSLQGSNVTSEIVLAEGLWPVEADAGQISQVLSNLIINARQTMTDGGTVKVSARNITRGGKGEARGFKFVLVQVEDSGPGIPAENLDRIFDPFFTTKESGHGLGLPVAYSIVKKHGGFIEVQSIVGAGTFFYVYLPASEKTPVPAETCSVVPLRPRKGRILLMDDDEAIRKLMLTGVQQAGYVADVAVNGREALALYHKALKSGQPYDAVVLDLTVPGGMGGKEAFLKLQKLNPDVAAVASSGYSDDPILADYAEYGFKNALTKPYTISTLLSMLDKTLRENRG